MTANAHLLEECADLRQKREVAVHELSMVQNVVAICESSAGGRRIMSVILEIGELSGVVPEAIEFCFEACSKGTLLEGAHLVIEKVAGGALCSACGATVVIGAYYEPCPTCGSHLLSITAGEGVRVKELEVA